MDSMLGPWVKFIKGTCQTKFYGLMSPIEGLSSLNPLRVQMVQPSFMVPNAIQMDYGLNWFHPQSHLNSILKKLNLGLMV